MTQTPAMQFHPFDGLALAVPAKADEFRKSHPTLAWFCNPWTGEKRIMDAVKNDPMGKDIVPPVYAQIEPGDETITAHTDPADFTEHIAALAKPRRQHAHELLNNASRIMAERGKNYDKPNGERSMARTVAAFNAVVGRDLTESEGWLFMQLLKDVRLFTAVGYHADSAEDNIAYAALLAEAKQDEARDV